MKLYNTLTKKLEKVKPLTNNTVRIYSCGPTVYNHAHIGNLSAYIFADTLRRSIAASGFKVVQVMNYTDVDDKTIKKSRELYKNYDPIKALKKLTDKYIYLFNKDMKLVGNNLDEIKFVRATETIEPMKSLISDLYKSSFAYIADDGVYFSIDKYIKSGKKYGQLTNIDSSNTSHQRIANDEYGKESIHDFALWKCKKNNEPAWEFYIDNHNLIGRPGWHIECSAMSKQELGQPFDIHTGGIDLIFPHHENEIAQSTALESNHVMAKIFSHNNHVLVDNKKMAKSADNFYTVNNIVEKGHNPLSFRLLVLQSHYRNQINFSWENLKTAQNRLKNLQSFADLRFQPINVQNNNSDALNYLINDTIQAILVAFQNDIDTPKALEELSKLQNHINESLICDANVMTFNNLLVNIDTLFGLDLLRSQDINNEQKGLLEGRAAAKTSQNFKESDSIRNKLKDQGINVRDTNSGQIWSRL